MKVDRCRLHQTGHSEESPLETGGVTSEVSQAVFLFHAPLEVVQPPVIQISEFLQGQPG